MDATEALERLNTIYERGLRPAEAVTDALMIYVELGEAIKDLQEAQANAKTVINDVFAEIGTDKLETPAGRAYVTKPSLRASYDTRGLDKLCQERPDIGAMLALYRQERHVPGTLTIRAGSN